MEFQGKLEGIDTAVETDYDGVPTYKEIQILVCTDIERLGKYILQFFICRGWLGLILTPMALH